MNYEVFCFIFGSDIVEKEYFDTYEEALKFQFENQFIYDCISITPMNEEAEKAMK